MVALSTRVEQQESHGTRFRVRFLRFRVWFGNVEESWQREFGAGRLEKRVVVAQEALAEKL